MYEQTNDGVDYERNVASDDRPSAALTQTVDEEVFDLQRVSPVSELTHKGRVNPQSADTSLTRILTRTALVPHNDIQRLGFRSKDV